MITADLLRVAGVTVTAVDIDEPDMALPTGRRQGRDTAQTTARIEFTAAGPTLGVGADKVTATVQAIGCW